MKKKNSKIFKICAVGVFTALGVVLASLIHMPIFPAVSFLEYDPADVPVIFCSLIFGPWYGLAMTVAVSLVQGLTVSAHSGWVGIIMHILATGSLSLTVGFIYRKKQTLSRMFIALAFGVLAMTATMALWNLIFTPYFMHLTLQELMPFYPLIVAFNLLKAAINSVIAALLYKSVTAILKKCNFDIE